MADDGGKKEKTRGGTSLVAEENSSSSCVMARQNNKQKYKGEDGTGGYGEQHQGEKTSVAMSRVNGGQG